ncbi:SDR family NAD(P)-dependent oxidoreductase [Mucilaginibacter auburnensis]|uniref:Short-subunit dehydrogenase n=1 Tax=Mucilaginibacter auburnensis TaxID=1457233 RepID=A0A2H9VND5_9SPHI|nr:SDR family oxidoreductase [Mucilaginibacter auburnensis]PJJ79841.1 short-subunit dehydrogenase [Mucilaginibacter auburnensis]
MKNAIITGATKGMGRAIAIAFAKENVNIAVCARGAEDLAAFKTELQIINPQIKIVTVVADGSDRDQLISFAETAQRELGSINIIVNNLGMYPPSSILDDEKTLFLKVVNTNLMPAYELYRFFGKSMVSVGEGHIFNICSIAALDPVPEAGIYSVTKAALLSLNNVMRLEMEQYGVKVTAVIPGSTLTDSWKGIAVDKNKMVLPEDVASAIINIYKMSAGANVDQIIIKPVYGQV